MTTSDPSRRAGLREWAGLAVLALPCLLVSMDANVLGLALPALTADLQPTSAQLLWIVDSYVFFVAGMLITMGVLGDRIGRRRLLLIGGLHSVSPRCWPPSRPALRCSSRRERCWGLRGRP